MARQVLDEIRKDILTEPERTKEETPKIIMVGCSLNSNIQFIQFTLELNLLYVLLYIL